MSQLEQHLDEIKLFEQYLEELYIGDTLNYDPFLCQPPRFRLSKQFRLKLATKSLPFDLLGNAIYRRTYSRVKANGEKEQWHETVIRVIQGMFAFLQLHHRKNHLRFDFIKMHQLAEEAATLLYDLKWSPPGRGLWAMGTAHVERYGSAALNNCYAVSMKNLQLGCSWAMDQLMNGGGVGFSCDFEGEVRQPDKTAGRIFKIPDSRQGWCAALELLISAYVPNPRTGKCGSWVDFDASLIRPRGTPIKGFGGTSMGAEPLRIMLRRIEVFFDTFIAAQKYPEMQREAIEAMMLKLYANQIYEIDGEGKHMSEERYKSLVQEVQQIENKTYGYDRLTVDIMNAIGCCVVAGNVRRSALIAVADADHTEFYKLKDYNHNPERTFIAWMSNNSIRLKEDQDFEIYLPLIAKQVNIKGELPGIVNLKNAQKYRRVGHELENTRDRGSIPNPCGEIILEEFEPCCLATVYPPRCQDEAEWAQATFFATMYAKIVTTIPHPWSQTNRIVQSNRRIGVSQTGLALLYDADPIKFRTQMAKRYREIVATDAELSAAWGVPRSIRVTTIKPEGTLSLLAGVPAGMHFPLGRNYLRRVRFGIDDPDLPYYITAGYDVDTDPLTANTKVVTFPCSYDREVRKIKEVDFFEQLSLARTLQECYSDNSVSSTCFYGDNYDGKRVSHAIAVFLPGLKSASFMPFSDPEALEETFALLPILPISDEEYQKRVEKIKEIDWKQIKNSKDAEMPQGCTGDTCTR